MLTVALNYGVKKVDTGHGAIDWNAVINTASNFVGTIIGVAVVGIIALRKYLPGALDTVAVKHGGDVVQAIQGVQGSIDKLQVSVSALEKAFSDSKVEYGRMEERVNNLTTTVRDLQSEMLRRRASDREA